MSQERTDNLFASESWTTVYTAFTNVSLKAYDFDTIREALLAYIGQTYPDKFNDFIASSEFIAILDLVAYLGHSLSYRLDMNTRENFMDTAERRASILQMAKTLGYNKTRPINAKGFMKIASLSTDEPVFDNLGISLAGKTVNWNDSNDIDWYENFISVLNSAFSATTKIQNPTSTLNVAEVDHSLYEVNETPTTKSVNYTFSANVDGKTRKFEAVRVVLDTTKTRIEEDEPNLQNNFTIVNRNDNLGSASDRTGFFVYAVSGTLGFKDFSYNTQISNRIEPITENNISNSDVWIQKIDSNRNYMSSVVKVDNETRETAIYNSLRTGSGDLVSINSADNNAIALHYPDGVFGNAAYGNYRTWYRVVDNDNFSVNANDISNATITIPYTGSDNRTYRLTLTISSTKDFSENFSGETYSSVRRIAPRSYYSQDRMVNAQDYNVYPLTLGNNVVNKVKAVNTSFAGNSRFYEMDDVLGHHSNLNITGSDGSVFVEDEIISTSLSYNKAKGSSDNFIRNDIAGALKHPSLLNKFIHTNRINAQVVVAQSSKSYAISSTDGTTITSSSMTDVVYAGDSLKLQTSSGTTIWADVKSVSGTTYTLNKLISESGEIKSVVRGFRTKFTDSEKLVIKNQVDPNTQSFTLYYTYASSVWGWALTSSTATDVSVLFTYKSGIRDNEAEYTATFTGKKIAFESSEQVKFYYGNTTDVVDNETNLTQRDTIYLNYLSSGTSVPSGSSYSVSDEAVNIGQVPVSTVVTDGGTGATFNAVFQYSGAPETYEFTESNAVTSTTYTHLLVSPNGVEHTLTSGNILSPASPNNIIGATPTYTLGLGITDLATLTDLSTSVQQDVPTVASTDTNLSNLAVAFTDGYTGNIGNAQVSTTTLTSTQITNLDFKGKVSLPYFSAAATTGNFKWRDVSDNVEVNDYTTVYDSTPQEYTFTNSVASSGIINHQDNDIFFKQYAYGQFTFTNAQGSDPLTTSNIVLRDANGVILDNGHITVTNTTGTTYKVVFWTLAVSVGALIDVYIGTSPTLSGLANYSVRVKATFDISNSTLTSTSTYKALSSYVYDDYYTSAGYIDNTKVKLMTADTTDNPFALVEVTADESIVMEEYAIGSITYERASKTYIATSNVSLVPTSGLIYYNTTTPGWWRRDGGSWTLMTAGTAAQVTAGTADYNDMDGNKLRIHYNGVQYRVLEGISFVEDPFTSFRWDHYADIDKRIDPSTSNIVDMYVLSSDYVRNVNKWVANNFTTTTPIPPNNYELSKIMDTIEPKATMADHIAYIPVEFKYLFGSYAKSENQAVFKVIKKLGVGYTDSEIKTAVSTKVNEYFSIDNWDFGDIFYFSELAAYLHKELGDYISSVVVTPKYSTNEFTKLLSISCALNEIFMAVTTSNDVKIITQLAQSELVGE
jgi:hypothetical protein